MSYKLIEAFGLKTRTWDFNEARQEYGCAECCTGDRCDEDCDAPYKGRRKDCPHCKGRGWIPKADITNEHPTTFEHAGEFNVTCKDDGFFVKLNNVSTSLLDEGGKKFYIKKIMDALNDLNIAKAK